MIDITAQNCSQDEPNPCNGVTEFYEDAPHVEWQCFLRIVNMQEIIPGVFLGPYSSAQNHCLATLLANDIKYIICVRQEMEAHFIRPEIDHPAISYLTLDIADNVTENIIRFFPKVRLFIDEALSKNCKVLVHGNSGNSRSATLVLAYIMEKYGLTSDEAMHFAKGKRSSINPNEGFVAQLTEYEPIYKARQTLNNGEPSHDNCRQKRKSEQLSETVDYDLIQPPPSPSADNNNVENYESAMEFTNNVYKSLWLLKK